MTTTHDYSNTSGSQGGGFPPPPQDTDGFYQHLPVGDGDILVGAAAIAKFLYGDAKQRRKVYYRVERGEIPFFPMGGTICSTRSALNRMIARDMREAARELEVN